MIAMLACILLSVAAEPNADRSILCFHRSKPATSRKAAAFRGTF